jgi:putative transposase
MSTSQALFPIALMARVLGVSTAGYYAWRDRPPSVHAQADAALLKQVRTVHVGSRQIYGAPRIHAQLRADGARHGRKRIARLMREAGLVGACHRQGGPTTQRDKEARPAPGLVDRDFTAQACNQLWVADITFVPTAAGFLYLAVVLDAWSRKIVGWSMANHLRTELVLDALEMVVGQRRARNVIHHSDQGSQYTSLAFGGRCREASVRPSMGSVGDAYDCGGPGFLDSGIS